ncbi:DinB family protein [Aureisphaera sp. CAU 1614]|uniref:DinB family protein n=1 Tax=Halomarinibacterium sedimenti TaxID=2857106 RepID=A0A9X1FMZ4_9FLAO|nr:DinB family protein [Halomarinibacterium sedimenti]MBW2937633.1 DinB family protein [Halomarinibacterium sedimenti]
MKKLIPILCITLMGFTTLQAQISKEERAAAIAEMTKTHDLLLTTIKGLSEEQLNFRSDVDSWSIAECVEHIAISENNLFGMAMGALETPADPSKRGDVKMTDEQLMAIIVDRSTKVKTSEAFEPSGKFGSFEETLNAFLEKRKSNMEFVSSTNADLRNHYAQLPFGTIDAYQALLFMSGHTERHILQIVEVMENDDFPGM